MVDVLCIEVSARTVLSVERHRVHSLVFVLYADGESRNEFISYVSIGLRDPLTRQLPVCLESQRWSEFSQRLHELAV